MNELRVIIVIIVAGVFALAQSFFTKNYFQLLEGKGEVGIWSYFLRMNKVEDSLKILLIIPMFSNGRKNEQDKVLRHRFIVNVLTVIIYILLMIMFVFIFGN